MLHIIPRHLLCFNNKSVTIIIAINSIPPSNAEKRLPYDIPRNIRMTVMEYLVKVKNFVKYLCLPHDILSFSPAVPLDALFIESYLNTLAKTIVDLPRHLLS